MIEDVTVHNPDLHPRGQPTNAGQFRAAARARRPEDAGIDLREQVLGTPAVQERCLECGRFVGVAPHACPGWLNMEDVRFSYMAMIDGVPVELPHPDEIRAIGFEHPQAYGLQTPEGSFGRSHGAGFTVIVTEDEVILGASSSSVPESFRAAVAERITESRRAGWIADPVEMDDEEAPSYVDDFDAFKTIYQETRDRRSNGGIGIDMLPTVSDGFLSPESGRGFGIEMEYDTGGAEWDPQAARAIAQDLYDAGLSTFSNPVGYHDMWGDYPCWRIEDDCTVSGEVVSPILYDTPECWEQVRQVCEIIRRHGGVGTRATGGHVNIGAKDLESGDQIAAVVDTINHYEDVMFRVGSNPETGRHRGTSWCEPNTDISHYQTVQEAVCGTGGAVSFGTISNRRGYIEQGSNPSSRIEYRFPDGTITPEAIQGQVALCAAVTRHAIDNPYSGEQRDREPLGTHARQRGQRRARLSGEEWRADTASFRQMADELLPFAASKKIVTQLFAATKWSRGR